MTPQESPERQRTLIYPQGPVLLKPGPTSRWLPADPQPCPFPPALSSALSDSDLLGLLRGCLPRGWDGEGRRGSCVP